MADVEDLIRPHIFTMPAYEPIVPVDVLSAQLGRPEGEFIKLDANENPYAPLPEVRVALADLPHVNMYPDPESRMLRRALAAYHGLPAENILAGAGADELIDVIIRLFIAPGDAILIAPPTFGMYEFDAGVCAARVISVRRRADFSLDAGGLLEAVRRRRPKLLFLASPNNPDGGLVPEEILGQLLAEPVVVVLDEAYIDFADAGGSRIGSVLSHDNLIVLRTFSKWAGLAGLRVGYGMFPAALMPHLWKIKQPYSVSVAASAAAMVSLAHAARLHALSRKIAAQRQRLFNFLAESRWLKPYPSQANFLLCRVIGRPAPQVKERLAAKGIYVRHFAKPGIADHLRITIGTPAQTNRLIEELSNLE